MAFCLSKTLNSYTLRTKRASKIKCIFYIGLFINISVNASPHLDNFDPVVLERMNAPRANNCSAPNTPFDWTCIAPTPNLEWTDCFSAFQCARLSVPLDYSNPDGEQAAIAIIKYPSIYAQNNESYRGPILFNPGGPGSSGVNFIKSNGPQFSNLLGNDFDIIGFDPRGVGLTTPRLSFFLNEAEMESWGLLQPPLLNSTIDSFARTRARAKLQGILASEPARSSNMSKHVSTAVVATDMLQITRAHGREKILYMGYSYGTTLGSTFAAMYPNNVERLVLDGVVDAPNYYAALRSDNLLDTWKTLQYFYDACSAGGPGNCPLYEATPDLVNARVHAILDSVKTSPVPARGPHNTSTYAIIDYRAAKYTLFSSLLKPFTTLPKVINALAALENGDGDPILALQDSSVVECDCDRGPNVFGDDGDNSPAVAIRCTDGAEVHDTIEQSIAHFEEIAETSEFADLWAGYRIECGGFTVRASWRFAGPFVANTSFPLLIVGNTADPVTPLAGAVKMSEGFEGSVVIIQNGPGHSSLAATSVCTQQAIRSYFRDGILPTNGTVCEIEDKLYDAGNGTTAGVERRDDLFAASGFSDVVRNLSAGFDTLFQLPKL